MSQKLKPGLPPLVGEENAKRFWQIRYYDFNVRTRKKQIEKLRYIHRNPVHRGLVEKPEDWPWSSFLHYATGVEGTLHQLVTLKVRSIAGPANSSRLKPLGMGKKASSARLKSCPDTNLCAAGQIT